MRSKKFKVGDIYIENEYTMSDIDEEKGIVVDIIDDLVTAIILNMRNRDNNPYTKFYVDSAFGDSCKIIDHVNLNKEKIEFLKFLKGVPKNV